MDELRRLRHDVRTPLHAARLAARVLRGEHPDEPLLDDLDASLDAILALVQPDDADVVDAVAVAKDVAAGLRTLFAAEQTEVQITGTYPVRAGAGRVRRVLQNLLANAAIHGGRHARVYVDGGLHVHDDGPGFEADATSPGEGLGWAACQEWVAQDGGSIERRDGPGGHIVIDWPSGQ